MGRPPNKRKQPMPKKMGKIRQYLTDNFEVLPEQLTDLKNGHMLLLYTNNDNSLGTTIKFVGEKLSCTFTNAQLNSVLKRAKKLKDVNTDAAMAKYMSLCCEPFPPFDHNVSQLHVPESFEPQQGSHGHRADHSDEHERVEDDDHQNQEETQPGSVPRTSEETRVESKTPSSSSSVRSSSRKNHTLTPRKLKLKKRLEFASQSKRTLQEKHREKVQKLRSQINFPRNNKIKRLNQELARKNIALVKYRKQIRELRRAKKSKAYSPLKEELVQSKQKLKNAKRQHKRLHNTFTNSVVNKERDKQKLKCQGKMKDEMIAHLENEKLCLEETVESMNSRKSDLTKEGRTYSSDMRMLIYDCIVNKVPMKNIPILLNQFAKRSGILLDTVPHRSTVEQMTRELGIISDFQSAEFILKGHDLTLGFDATTQEGVHVNSIHITSKHDCHVLAIDQLPGGTAEDYEHHIHNTIANLSTVHSKFSDTDCEQTRESVINNISNTMTDRAAVNHATIQRVELNWNKKLNELNCHLHPLDTIASSVRTALKANEPAVDKKLYGTDCAASNLILAINKFRYKDGKGDPKGFVSALDSANLPRGLLPRYRGNRLHIMFHIAGKLHEHSRFFTSLFEEGTVTCGGLQGAILHDFKSSVAQVELQVLGLLGKLLSGPWMAKFYRSSSTEECSHVDGIAVVKEVIHVAERFSNSCLDTLTTATDFFGQDLAEGDHTLEALRSKPVDEALFSSLMKSCLMKVVEVLERQYHRYFGTDLTDQLMKETQSARCHNIDAEEIMGMFSAAKDHAPNATMSFLSAKIRAQKNRVVDYLDSMVPEKRKDLIDYSINMARKLRVKKRKQTVELRLEIASRLSDKKQRKNTVERNRLEKKLKACDTGSLDINVEFANVKDNERQVLASILAGNIVSHQIAHVWYDSDTHERVMYFGKVEKLLKKGGGTYRIGYWGEGKSYEEDAEDYDVSKYALAADFLNEDLTI